MRRGKTIRSLLIGIFAVIAVLVVCVFFVARSQAFQRFLLAKLVQQTEQRTGARVYIQNIKISWMPFTADLYGVIAHGVETNSQAPLFAADRLSVSLVPLALLKHHVDVSDVVIDRPTVNFRIDAQGNSNLPHGKTSHPPSSFSTEVHHLSIQNGTVNYNDRQIPLDAELHDFRVQANYDVLTATYKGTLAYDHGWVAAENLNRFEHDAQVNFEASGDRVVVQPLVLSLRNSRITLKATLTHFDRPQVDGQYDAKVDTVELAHILKNGSIPSGQVVANGTLNYSNSPDEHFIESLAVDGRASSTDLRVREQQLAARLTSVRGSYKIAHGILRISSFDSELLGGRMTASGQVGLSGDSHPQIHAHVSGASLQQMSNVLPARDREDVRLVGRADAELNANWTKTRNDFVLQAHVAAVGPEEFPAERDIPVNGTVDLIYDAAHQTASFRPSHLRTGKTDLTLAGTVSRRSSLNVTLQSGDLHELAALVSTIASNPTSAGTGASARPYDIYGAGRFAGQISGSLSAPQIRGDVSASALQVQGSKCKTVHATIEANPSSLRAQNGLLQSDGPGQINFSGQIGLQNWKFTPASPLSLHANWKQLSLADVVHLARTEYPVSGSLSGDISLEGSEQHPSGHGSLHLVQASLWNQPVTSISVDFQGDKDSIHTNTQINVPAGTAHANITYSPTTQYYEMTLDSANLRLEQLQLLQARAGTPIKGMLTLKAEGEGTLAQPQFHATLDVPQLQASSQTLSQVHAQVDLAQQHAHVTLTSAVEQASVQAKGDLTLTGNYPMQANWEVHGAPIAALVAKYLPNSQTGLDGSMDARGSFNGPLKAPLQLQAAMEIPTLKLGYKSLQITNEGPLRFDYRGGMVTVQQARLKGNGTDFSLQGAIPILGDAPINVTANGVVDVSLLQLLASDAHASGQIKVQLRAEGKWKDPAMNGQIQLVNASYGSDSLPFSLTSFNGQMDVSGNRIDVREIKGTAGGGTVTTHGSLTIGKAPGFALAVEAKSVRVHENDIRSTLDGNLQLSGNTEKASLTGRILVDRLSFEQGSDISTILGQFSGTPTPSAPSAFETNTELNISVQSSDELSAANSQFSVAGSANLTVTNTLANPVILGRIALTGGDVFFLSKRFELQNGTIAFSNPIHTEPVLNLFVTTTVEQYNITINFLGPIDRLKTNYTSDPSLPPLDIINLLAFGQTTAEQSANAATPTSLGAESVVAEGVAGQVAKGVQSLTGISQLTLDPLAGSNQNPGAQVAIQERVSGNVLFTFSTNVTTTQNQTVQVEYEPKKHVTISVLRDEYGGYGIDVKLHKVF